MSRGRIPNWIAALSLLAAICRAQDTEILYLSGTDKDRTVDWDFFCTAGRKSGVWTKIPVPSNWELQGFGSYNYGHDSPKSDEKGLYRHRFEVPSSWRGKRVFIVFEGSMTDTEVFVNDKPAGPVHQGGFYRFRYDVTDLLIYGAPNGLAVTVAKQSADPTVNAAERTSDYWVFGGIFRPVYLEACPPSFIERVAVNARGDGAFMAEVHVRNARGGAQLTGQIRTLEGAAIGNPFSSPAPSGDSVVTVGARIPEVSAWTPETPHLYRFDLRLKQAGADLHRIQETIGFRTVELRPEEGVYVNGRKVRLKGVNRHSFWPDAGRTTSREVSLMDIELIKDMNMNAVRMSHYPPDAHFLELCDSKGLFVLDELAGWQHAYGLEVGEKLVQELVVRDVNHPSVIMWDNGNEGGWNRDLDDDFAKYDPQKRPVIHPWERFNYTDTGHYRAYGCCPGAFFQGRDVFFPTEFLHGLYDGGSGAALDDYWNAILSRPNGAGGFLWAFLDEAVKRTDRGGVLDTDGNHAPDGIVGPYREKEASFYSIKEIWSPVFIGKRVLPPDFDGRIEVENRYDFTNLERCKFEWKLVRFRHAAEMMTGYVATDSGTCPSPSLPPWTKGALELNLPADWRDRDALLLTAKDPHGRELYTWTWTIKSPGQIRARVVAAGSGQAQAVESPEQVTLLAAGVEVQIDKASGMLAKIRRDGKAVSLSNGPAPAVGTASLTSLRHFQDGADHVVEAQYSGALRLARWRIHPSGWLRLDYEYELNGEHDYLGISFDYPEGNVQGMKWLGKGPYRVWKNRTKGVAYNVWTKAYNDTKTGASWAYPEFKGYHANFYWAVVYTSELPIAVVTDTDDLFFRMFTPSYGDNPVNTAPRFPPGGFSFLQGIPPIGTKFHEARDLGPEGLPNEAAGTYRGTLYFHFGSVPSL